MSVFDKVFGKSVPASAPAPAPAPVPETTKTAPDSETTKTVPEKNEKEAKSPLAGFENLFKVEDEKDKSKAQEQLPNPFALDPKKVLESAGNLDFSKAVSQETLKKIQDGGPEASVAMFEAMNAMLRQVYAYSLMSNATLAERAYTQSMNDMQLSVPNLVRKYRANEEVSSEYPVLNHPAVAPLAQAITQQIAAKEPNLTAQQIKQRVATYLQGVGKLITSNEEEDVGLVSRTGTRKGKQQETDWESLFLNS